MNVLPTTGGTQSALVISAVISWPTTRPPWNRNHENVNFAVLDDITEILLKMAFNTIPLTKYSCADGMMVQKQLALYNYIR